MLHRLLVNINESRFVDELLAVPDDIWAAHGWSDVHERVLTLRVLES